MLITDTNGNTEEVKDAEKWLLEHPPMYYWFILPKKDFDGFEIFEGRMHRPNGYDDQPHDCPTYTVKGDRKDYEDMMITESRLRDSGKYAIADKRNDVGLTDELKAYLLKNYPPENYGHMHDAFDIRTDTPGGWGYGTEVEVRYKGVKYPDGTYWNTYQNEYGFHKADPTKKQIIEWCDRIDVNITITMGKKHTPTEVIERALRLTEDRRLHDLLNEVINGKG